MNAKILTITLLYFFLSLLGIFYHELWVDEAHHILLGRDSHSISELIYNSRYEGHPLLWNLIVYWIMHLFNSIICVQIFHVLIATTCVFLILRYVPFSLHAKLLMIFGYFLLYEYAVISRNYSLSLLFILLIVIAISSSKKNFPLIMFLLAILCHTHLFSCILAISFFLFLLPDLTKLKPLVKYISLTIFVTGLALSILHIIPPQDHFLHHYNEDTFFSMNRLSKVMWVPLKGILPLPTFLKTNYWNSNWFIDNSYFLALTLSLVCFAAPAFLFFKYHKVLIFFYTSAIGIMIFIYVTPLMLTSRNCGFMSMILLTALWLKEIQKSKQIDDPLQIKNNKIAYYFTTSVLLIQFFSGIIVFYFDITRNFSNSKCTATYLNNISTDSIPQILLTHHSSGPSISAYLNRKLFYLESYKKGSFCEWNTNPFTQTDSVLLIKMHSQLKQFNPLILVTNHRNKLKELMFKNNSMHLLKHTKIKYLASFSYATLGSENYFIYLLSD